MSVLFDPSLISARSIAWLALLLDASVKGLVVIAAAGVVCLALRRASAASRHLVWSLAMVSLIVLPVFSAALPSWQVPILPRPALQLADGGRSGVPPDRMSPASHGTADETPPALPVASRYAEPASVELGSETEISAEATIRARIRNHLRGHWPAWTLSVWALGAVTSLAPLLIGMVGVWERARHATEVKEGLWAALLPRLSKELGVRSRVSLLQTDSSIIPTTCGALRPNIFLPSDAETWPEEKCRIVLLHELAHIRRRDWLAQTVARVACSLHWFNPLAWLAARRLRVESEQACDDSVLRAGYKASGYADQLLEIVRSMARSRCASLATVPIARSPKIERRMAALLDATRNRRALTHLSVALALIAVTCTVLPLAALRPTTRNAQAEEALVSPTLPSGAEIQADYPEREPWLEYRLLSQTPVPGYKQVTTPQGEKYYCAPTSFLDPIGFADVLPASNGNGLRIVLTPAAAKRHGEFMSEHVGDSIGILVDGELVRGPAVIGEPLMGRGKRFSLSPQLGDEIDDSLIRAWSAPPDTSPGRHRLHIHGLGTIETELHHGSPGDFQFLHEASVYCLPSAFAGRPELNPKEKTVQEAVIREDDITVGDERFATVQEALAYIKNQAGPERLVLVTISKEQADTWPQARLTELMPLIDYLNSAPPYVGFRQRMADGWTWPTKENAPGAVAQPDEGEGTEPLGADLTREIDSSVPEQAREAPYGPAHVPSQMETLEAESLQDSLGNLSDMSFWWGPIATTREDAVLARFPMPADQGRDDIRCIMGNKRVLKLLKELAHLPSAEAGALVQEHLMAALSEYQSAFQELFGPDKIGPPRRVKPGERPEGPSLNSRYEILSLAFIAGHLELESTFPAVLELAQYAREQREYVYQCYLTDKIPELEAYSLLADGSLYNRLVICTALLRTRGGEREATSAQKPRGRSITFITQKVPAYDAFLVPRDPKRWPPEPMEPKIEVTFIRAFTDDGFDRVIAEVTK